MKHWQETAAILDRLAELTADGKHAAVACVVKISGSAYRRPGARFLIVDDGTTMGGISGGCLEEDVRHAGLGVIGNGESRLLHYETGDDDESLWGLGLGCDGEVDVLVAAATGTGFPEAARDVREMLAGDRAFTAMTLLSDGKMSVLEADSGEHLTRTIEVDGGRAFVECFEPPPYLVICGAGDDAMPMVQSAADAGFRVVVVDHRAAYLASDRFPAAWRLVEALPEDDVEMPATADTFVVLKTHNLSRDKAWARRLLSAPIPYLGLLGPRARCEEIADEAAVTDAARVFGPVGLDLGAEGPEQVGLAVVAELLAVRSGRPPGHLKNREAPIHDPE